MSWDSASWALKALRDGLPAEVLVAALAVVVFLASIEFVTWLKGD